MNISSVVIFFIDGFFDPGGSRTQASLTDGRADTTLPLQLMAIS